MYVCDTCVIKEQQKQQELFRIEQYAYMALQYTRLGAESNDFVLEQVVLDEVIKHSVRKYAKQFIHKKLQLCYEPREIRAEDLPRVCEMGYTGYNGHADQYSTGIGLYLCKSILDKLGHRLLVTSTEGVGTQVEILIADS